IKQTIIKLNELAELGIKIAIDDFGTGYSSLAYLKQFPVNRLKIDKSFVDDITLPDDADLAIVKATIQMADALHITTIAEGVETQDQLTLLKALGCNEVQGYFYSKPLPANELHHFIKKKVSQSVAAHHSK
ncbi:MAG: EAL domain-containing protein, partial [Thiomicrorhabdus sp.]|nr:EAL domain-containing protein [Thiomicrorhabdus sp.]